NSPAGGAGAGHEARALGESISPGARDAPVTVMLDHDPAITRGVSWPESRPDLGVSPGPGASPGSGASSGPGASPGAGAWSDRSERTSRGASASSDATRIRTAAPYSVRGT